ncbi:hypothetical protein AGMMS49929_10660 [Endomicrobiia bacterium]|nr:hypothetical protein AGMMS49571_10960 [Endomicrobiia bacterium]GHT21739.1 hypothetical protein AGMMS49929_10660 [Endomicrobiia bacterium]
MINKLIENIFSINNPFRSSRTVQKDLKIINKKVVKNFVCNIIVLSLFLCSCGKKQALLNTAIIEKSEVVSELKSELAKIQKELEEEKEKVIQVQEELEKANQRNQNQFDLNQVAFFLLGYTLVSVAVMVGLIFYHRYDTAELVSENVRASGYLSDYRNEVERLEKLLADAGVQYQ